METKLINKARAIEAAIEEIELIPSLNLMPFQLNCISKGIYEGENGFIYKLDNPLNTMQRLLLERFFSGKGFSLFLEEKIIFSSPHFILTKQRKVSCLNHTDNEILHYLQREYGANYQLLYSLLIRLSIMGFGKDNCGTNEKGEIKFFDVISNTACYQQSDLFILVDFKGEVLSNGGIQSFEV